MSRPARSSRTTHNPDWRSKIPKSDTRNPGGEMDLRKILEKLGYSFHSQGRGRADFMLGELAVQDWGSHHKGKQTVLDHDAYAQMKAREEGRLTVPFWDWMVRDYPGHVATIIACYAHMTGLKASLEAPAK